MMLSPADIDNKQFSTTRLKEGYDQTEVDEFLDRVQADYKALDEYVQRLEKDNAALRRVADSTPTQVLSPVPQAPSAVAEKLLQAAEAAAKEFETEAKIKADEIVREAGSRGASIVEEATEAAERIKSDGLAEKYRRIEELSAKERKLTGVVDKLVADASQVRRAMQAAIQSYDKETAL